VTMKAPPTPMSSLPSKRIGKEGEKAVSAEPIVISVVEKKPSFRKPTLLIKAPEGIARKMPGNTIKDIRRPPSALEILNSSITTLITGGIICIEKAKATKA